MPCIHGIDEMNCPICRISKSSIPINVITKIKSGEEDFLIKSPFIKDFSTRSEEYEKEINRKSQLLQPKIINPVPKPNLINEIPLSENKILLERLSSKDIENVDKYGISKRIPIKKGELEFK